MKRLTKRIFSTFYKIFNLYPSSLPYISGDTFKSISDFIFQPNFSKSFKLLKTLESNSIIFLKINQIEEFMTIRSLFPEKRFKLILHNSDLEFSIEEYLKLNLFNDLIFTQNCNYLMSNLTPIPIGLENRHFHNNGVIIRYKKLSKNNPKYPLIFYSFTVSTNVLIRERSLNYLEKSIFSVGYQRLDHSEYMKEMSNYMFCFSPPGNGIDCHRTWESMAINVVPICFRSPLIDYFVSLGLPIWVIDNLSDLDYYQDTKKLESKYIEISSAGNKYPLYFSFWESLIDSVNLL